MDLHPDAAASMSAYSPPHSGAQPPAPSGGHAIGSPAGVERRVDDALHLRARLLKMIVTQEQARKATTEFPPR